MAHAPADEAPIPDGYSVSDEFFVYKFSKEQAGLSGLAFDEGIFGVFGYITEASSSPLQPAAVAFMAAVPVGVDSFLKPCQTQCRGVAAFM